MGYTKNTKLTPALQHERDLLLRGLSYKEVAAMTGSKVKSISERNRLVYGVDLRSAFSNRIDRDGIKKRHAPSDAFGYWFSGFFDGEGCLTVFCRRRTNGFERRVGVQISCRYDDAQVIDFIYKSLNVGVVWDGRAKGLTNKTKNWRVERAADLTEVILPVFDNYPLRSKKRLEYSIWRGLVIQQYINTLGGNSTRVGATDKENAAFQDAMNSIRKIRHPFRIRIP